MKDAIRKMDETEFKGRKIYLSMVCNNKFIHNQKKKKKKKKKKTHKKKAHIIIINN